MQTAKFADIEQAQRIARELYPDAVALRVIDHGYDNIVVLVDEATALRFPRNVSAYRRSMYERSVLKKLGAIDVVEVPKLLAEGDDPAYMETSFVAGSHVSAADVRLFTHDEQVALGETVATFAYQLHSSVSVAEEKSFRQQAEFGAQFDEPWSDYFERVIATGEFVSDAQRTVAREYYKNWRAFQQAAYDEVVIHDDLYTNNMLFEDHALVGVVDFGDASFGTPEQELRQLFRISDTVLSAGVEKYEALSGKKLDVEAIKTWAILREIAAYSRRIGEGHTTHAGFQRSCMHLREWLPQVRWDIETQKV